MSQNDAFSSSWHVSVAAESVTAYFFARHGYDVSVQYGANQPEYDLMVSKGETIMKVSVKGSKDGGWGLTQKYKREGVTYHQAIDHWLARHSKKTIFSLVQFINTGLNDMPRVYLATPEDIVYAMKSSRDGQGDTVLREEKIWKVSKYKTEKIPSDWIFSQDRIEQLTLALGVL